MNLKEFNAKILKYKAEHQTVKTREITSDLIIVSIIGSDITITHPVESFNVTPVSGDKVVLSFTVKVYE